MKGDFSFAVMGGVQSKTSNKLDSLADSNSVRQRHDEKVLRRDGVKHIGYVPRKQLEFEDTARCVENDNCGGKNIIIICRE